ncbi:hypothetical protein T492DRAFT_985751 [Pavlovales sp. CCMP2436]|nr:hypothetical protein T492DRAFT_985751 [Pavlovales sp. CCMP2436]
MPTALAAVQCAAAAAMVLIVRAFVASPNESTTAGQCVHFASVPLALVCCILASSELAASAGLNARVLVAALSPVAVSVADRFLVGDQPSARGAVALAVVLAGGVYACYATFAWTKVAATWSAATFAVQTYELVWVKMVMERVHMSVWARVFVTNFVAAALLAAVVRSSPECARNPVSVCRATSFYRRSDPVSTGK